MIWPCGSIVRYGKELYKAEAEMNSAEPGSSSQSRFYVNFVQNFENPLNIPETRPIEKFWGLIKGEVYKNNWQAENLDKLKNMIKFCLKKSTKV